MTLRFRLAVASVLFGCLAACASPTSVEPLVAPAEEDAASLARASVTIDTLVVLRTGDEMRALLSDGLTERELTYVGFDHISIGECIDCIVRAVLEERTSGGGPRTRRQLHESLEVYFAATREAVVRRSAGAAPCLPYLR